MKRERASSLETVLRMQELSGNGTTPQRHPQEREQYHQGRQQYHQAPHQYSQEYHQEHKYYCQEPQEYDQECQQYQQQDDFAHNILGLLDHPASSLQQPMELHSQKPSMGQAQEIGMEGRPIGRAFLTLCCNRDNATTTSSGSHATFE